MDQVTMVNELTESGKRLIDALGAEGFAVRIAFWAKPTDEDKWYLYLASSFVDDHGSIAAYLLVNRILRKLSDLWIDSLEIKVIGINDSLASAALKVTKPRVPVSPFATENPKPYSGMTRIGSTTLGGLSIDAAYFYPPTQSAAPV